MKKHTFILGAVAVIFVFAGCEQVTEKKAPAPNDALLRVNTAPSAPIERPAEEDGEVKEAMIDKEVEMAKRFIDGGTAALVDSAGGDASGTARLAFADGKTEHYVTADGLPSLDANYFYEGWLVRDAASGDFISTGEMTFNRESKMWELDYTEEGVDRTDHLGVVITLEPRDDDPAPADHVLDGTITFGDGERELQ